MAAEVLADDVEPVVELVAANPVESANKAAVVAAAHRSTRAMCRELMYGLVRIDNRLAARTWVGVAGSARGAVGEAHRQRERKAVTGACLGCG
jgi:hypothetical protein